MKKARKKRSGAGRMQDLGYRQVQLWLSQTEYAAIAEAARLDQRKVTAFCMRAAAAAATAAGVTSELRKDPLVIQVTVQPPGAAEPRYVLVPYNLETM